MTNKNKVFNIIWRNNELQHTVYKSKGPKHVRYLQASLRAADVKAKFIKGSDQLMQGADVCRYGCQYRPGRQALPALQEKQQGNRAAPPAGYWGNLFTLIVACNV